MTRFCNPELTVLVLHKGDIFLIAGVQNPEDGIQVGAGEQVRSSDSAPLQLLQLLQQELSGVL